MIKTSTRKLLLRNVKVDTLSTSTIWNGGRINRPTSQMSCGRLTLTPGRCSRLLAGARQIVNRSRRRPTAHIVTTLFHTPGQQKQWLKLFFHTLIHFILDAFLLLFNVVFSLRRVMGSVLHILISLTWPASERKKIHWRYVRIVQWWPHKFE